MTAQRAFDSGRICWPPLSPADPSHTPLPSRFREDLLATMLPVYQELIESEELRILVFSGDVDGILPVVGTRRWVEGLGLKQVKIEAAIEEHDVYISTSP